MNNKLVQKINSLPTTPGVYLFRNEKKEIIYVGKAVSLKSRVKSYFSKTIKDIKTEQLVKKICDIDYRLCETGIDALYLESELIKRYRPRFNFDLRDDKNYSYIKVTKENYPKISLVHQTSDDKSIYLGPYIDSSAVKLALSEIRKIYPYCSCRSENDKKCLFFHLGLCPGQTPEKITPKSYQKQIKHIIRFFSGESAKVIKELKKEMLLASKNQKFEQAGTIRNRYLALEKITHTRVKNVRQDLTDEALSDLAKRLGLSSMPRRIECYDISNLGTSFPVGAMVVFENGLPKKNDYRHFKIKPRKNPDDFAMIGEIIARRIKRLLTDKKDNSFSQPPNLIVVDGGLGQLRSAYREITNHSVDIGITVIGLAKKQEDIYILKKDDYQKITLPPTTEALYLLQRIRDEAHRFAITYHRLLRSKQTFNSELDNIKGIGKKKKKRLLDSFGTVKKIKSATTEELAKVVGSGCANEIKRTK